LPLWLGKYLLNHTHLRTRLERKSSKEGQGSVMGEDSLLEGVTAVAENVTFRRIPYRLPAHLLKLIAWR
jgi:hypothetical protein